MSTSVVRVVVTDSNVLINLMHVLRLDLLGRMAGHEFVVPDHVRNEITHPDQRSQADADKLSLEQRKFKMSFASFWELIE